MKLKSKIKSRDEKIRDLISIAQGAQRPVEVREPEIFIWMYRDTPEGQIYQSPDGSKKCTREEVEQYGRTRNILQLIFIPVRGNEYKPLTAEDLTPPTELERYAAAQEAEATQDERTDNDLRTSNPDEREPTPQAPNRSQNPKPDIIIGSVKPGKTTGNFEEIDWVDIPSDQAIDYMFGRRDE